MKTLTILFSLFIGANCCLAQNGDNTITISGRVTDFNGNPIDSCRVNVLYAGFSVAYSDWSDKDGYYSIPNVEKGKYMAIYALRPEEYPRQLKVDPENMRLEFWAWNVIADRNLTINPRYHRLELYGTTVFKENGGLPIVMIYTRPMSLGRWMDAKKAETEDVDISAEPDEIEFRVYANDAPVILRSVQPVEEYVGGRRQMAYLIYVDLPKKQFGKYCIFRIEAHNRAYGGESGENVYFYEFPEYK